MSSLCATFRQLAVETWNRIGQGRLVGHQLLEDTITDLICLELKTRHPTAITTYTFNKVTEGTTGADWEWWLSDPLRKQWLGIRVQAKILHTASSRFKQLHYVTSSKGPQISLLESDAASNGAIPLYCLYLEFDSRLSGVTASPWPCPTFAHAPDLWGCALCSTSNIRKLKSRDGLADVLPFANPWHCLVCCSGYGGDSLPARAAGLLTRTQLIGEASGRQLKTREQLPEYVRRLAEEGGASIEDLQTQDERLGRVTLIFEPASA
jgi:hypothetical protein